MFEKTETLIVLTPAFPPNESAGQSPWVPAVQNFVKAINRSFPELEVIVFAFRFPDTIVEYSWHGNKVIPFGGALRGKLSTIRVWISVWGKLVELKNRRKVVGSISFWCTECCLIGSYFKKVYSINHLCWISGQDAKKENKFVKLIKPKTTELVAMSDFLADEFFKNHGKRPAYVVPNGVDLELVPTGHSERTIDILAAGSLIPLKRYNILLDVISELKPHFPTIKVCICGNGPEELNLKTKIEKQGLGENIQLLGLLPHQDVIKLLKKSKLLAHPSEYEGFSNVCLESLACGTPVVSFTKAMNEDIPNWHIVSSPAEMKNKIEYLLMNETFLNFPVFDFDINLSAGKLMNLLRFQF
jgi:glycosyltransferase involved in cell wall biosynthesis